jgi:hypothetical protein
MRVFTQDASREITPVSQANGFFRINRIAGIDFYRIKGAFAYVKQESPRALPMSLTVTRHARAFSIGYFSSGGKEVKIDIMDCQGRTLKTFVDPDRRTGMHHMDFASSTNGIAIVKAQIGDAVMVKKVLIP